MKGILFIDNDKIGEVSFLLRRVFRLCGNPAEKERLTKISAAPVPPYAVVLYFIIFI